MKGSQKASIDEPPLKKYTPGSRNIPKIRSFGKAASITWRKGGHGKREKKATIYLFGEKDNSMSKDKISVELLYKGTVEITEIHFRDTSQREVESKATHICTSSCSQHPFPQCVSMEETTGHSTAERASNWNFPSIFHTCFCKCTHIKRCLEWVRGMRPSMVGRGSFQMPSSYEL